MAIELINDSFQGRKCYNIPKAQLIVADVPYNIGEDAYGSSPQWYNGGDRRNGESSKAKKSFFASDGYFNLYEFFHFASKMMKPEPKLKAKDMKGSGKEPGCMFVFCAFDQQETLIKAAKKHGFVKYQNFVFFKNYSGEVLKANMRCVGNMEYALMFYRDKLPKFRNTDENGERHMVFTGQQWQRENKNFPKIHPTQKPIAVLESIIRTFTDEGDVVIDPVAGSGSTLYAAAKLGRNAYGFETSKQCVRDFYEKMLPCLEREQHTLLDSTKETA